MKTKITDELLTRYLGGQCTPAEVELIAAWYHSFEELPPYFDNELSADAIELKAQTRAAIKTAIAIQKQQSPAVLPINKRSIRMRVIGYSSVAAAILILLTTGLYWMYAKSRMEANVIVLHEVAVNDTANIIPGANKAILTLADGSSVVLDDAKNGTLARQNNMQVIKSKDGEVQYRQANGNGPQNGQVAYNILATPRGGQYMIVLPDGSKVWLNAASSIKYPTAFTGKERRVEITGEVYFEVATLERPSGQKMPFKVIINKRTTVEVLGTHFNVNAYDDEGAVKTTLLEGSVRMGNGEKADGKEQSVVLKPGEQAVLASDSRLTIDRSPDLNEVMAWKNGLFQFNNVTIETVMRQVARWYDVQVVYERDVSQDLFHGKIYRSADIGQLLKILELSGAHFKIEGKRIIVQ